MQRVKVLRRMKLSQCDGISKQKKTNVIYMSLFCNSKIGILNHLHLLFQVSLLLRKKNGLALFVMVLV